MNTPLTVDYVQKTSMGITLGLNLAVQKLVESAMMKRKQDEATWITNNLDVVVPAAINEAQETVMNGVGQIQQIAEDLIEKNAQVLDELEQLQIDKENRDRAIVEDFAKQVEEFYAEEVEEFYGGEVGPDHAWTERYEYGPEVVVPVPEPKPLPPSDDWEYYDYDDEDYDY